MKKFKIIETKPAVEFWSYVVEAESQEQAIEMIREGLVDHEDYWISEDPFERFEYEVESEEEVEE